MRHIHQSFAPVFPMMRAFRPTHKAHTCETPLGVWNANEATVWQPRADILASATQFSIIMDLPGLAKEEVSIQLKDQLLTIFGKRDTETSEATAKTIRTERWRGRFSRSFRLPQTADQEQIKASFANGVLTVEIPKKSEAPATEIQIG